MGVLVMSDQLLLRLGRQKHALRSFTSGILLQVSLQTYHPRDGKL